MKNKEPLSQDEIKSESLEILKAVHAFCEEHGISYFMDYGTLLGAVRHKGFIPWDDDIDISMLRADYEKFVSSFNIPGYTCVTYKDEEKFVLPPYAKISSDKTFGTYTDFDLDFGISIDVFPKDTLPAAENLESATKKIFALWKKFIRAKNCETVTKISSPKDLLKRLYAVLFSSKKASGKLEDYAVQCGAAGTDRVGTLIYPSGTKLESIDRNAFKNSVLLDFEDVKLHAPVDYDAVLTAEYGSDYMTPPPESERQSFHSVEKYYWK